MTVEVILEKEGPGRSAELHLRLFGTQRGLGTLHTCSSGPRFHIIENLENALNSRDVKPLRQTPLNILPAVPKYQQSEVPWHVGGQ